MFINNETISLILAETLAFGWYRLSLKNDNKKYDRTKLLEDKPLIQLRQNTNWLVDYHSDSGVIKASIAIYNL